MNNENLGNNIFCSKCGTSNIVNTNFCVSCGNQLNTSNLNNSINTNHINPQFNNQMLQPNMESQLNINTNQTNVQNNNQTINSVSVVKSNVENMNYFKYIINSIIKPFDSFNKEKKKLSNFKNSGILLTIIVVALALVNLISTMITSVRVISFWSGEVTWVWENLKNIAYFKIIIQNVLMYAGIIFAISGVYFLASLVIKKEAKFVKLLSAVITAFIPLAISMSILAPLLTIIYSYLGVVITIVGVVYFIIVLLELLNEQIIIENKNTRIYFHLICLSILLIVGSFVVYKFIFGSLVSGLGSLLG